MDYPIVDFLTLCETPYPNGELQHPPWTGSVSVLAKWNDILVNFVLFLFSVPDFQEPYAVVVLLEKDLVVIDLGQIG